MFKFKYWYQRTQLFLYTLFVLSLFFIVMLWMTPSGQVTQRDRVVPGAENKQPEMLRQTGKALNP